MTSGRLERAVATIVFSMLLWTASYAAPQEIRFTFENGVEGWGVIPPPTGSRSTLTLSEERPDAQGDGRALRLHYILEPEKFAGVLRTVDGLPGTAVRVRLKTATAAFVAVGLVEKDGSGYQHVFRTLPGRWKEIEVAFDRFSLGDDSKDANGRLDPEQVETLVVADLSGFLPGAAGEGTLWIDHFEVVAQTTVAPPEPYVPLLATGHPTVRGTRATGGVSYQPGRFGLGVVTDAPGEMVVVPAKGIRREEGTIEVSISPRFDMEQVQDFAGLVAMQTEPFVTGMTGSLLLFYTKTRQIAFLLNADMDHILATPPLAWRAGEWHQLAASWGPQGMRLYLDGRPVGQNRYRGGPGRLSADVVVGNQAWTIASQRFANTVMDEFRLSSVQRSDEQIAASARAERPLDPDGHTVALEHFDGHPSPPITLAPGAVPFHGQRVGKPVELTVLVPDATGPGARLAYTVSTPVGAVVHRGAVPLGEPKSPSDGAGHLDLSLPPFTTPGFYRIAFRLERGGEILNVGTDWFRLVSSSAAEQRSSLLFGASSCYADPQDHESFFRNAASVGVRSLRMPFEWAEIEPDDDRFVWDRYDRIVAWAEQYGVELVPTFIWEKAQPAWAGPGTVEQGLEEKRHPPEDLAKWRDFVFHVVRRYRGTVRWWIPANEPNLAKYWYPEPDAGAYVALLKATRNAARQADPNAKILGCSVAGTDLRFLEACFQAGALDHCDAVGIHPYICPHSPDESIPVNLLDPSSQVGTFREGLLAATALIGRYGGKQKLWLDEAGQNYRDDFIVPDFGVDEETAAAHLVKIHAQALACTRVERVLWFSFWGGEYGSFALLRPDGSPTLPLIAYTACVRRLGGATFVGEGRRGKDVRTLVFRRGRQQIDLVWSLRGEKQIRLRPGERAFDLYGFPSEEADRTRRLALSSVPAYIVRQAGK